MPYVTHIVRNTRVMDSRLTPYEAIMLELNPERQDGYATHSKGFFNTHTFWTENPRIPSVQMYHLSTVLREPFTKEYLTFRIPKASGGTRTIEAPADELKILQRKIADYLLHNLSILSHNSAYAYTRGRCAYDALVTHQRRNARWFLKLDIKDFFPSITREVLSLKLKEIYPLNFLSSEDMDRLVDIAVNESGSLPQGSPLSPILSNLVMTGFDLKLSTTLKRFKGQTYTYTRYADDMLISCPYSFRFEDVLELVEQGFNEMHLPFRINREKLRYASKAGRNWNLGLMYTQDQTITVGTKKKRELHSLVNSFMVSIIEDDWWNKSEVQQLIGQLGYLKNVEPDYYHSLINKYEVKYATNFTDAVRHVLNS